MVKISVIMPVYNAQEHLEESISSVISQSLNDIELICVNDGSSDNSLNILNELSKSHEFIKIFTKDNEGSGIARNYGMAKAKGEYIAFLDSDDIFVDANALELMYECAIEHDADMVSANLKGLNLKGELVVNDVMKLYTEKRVIDSEIYGIPWEFYKNIFKRSFLEKHNITFPDLKRGQDPVFLAKVLSRVDRIPALPIDLYGFRYPKRRSMFKINNHIKRRDYVRQFRCCYEILNDAGLSGVAEEYISKLYEFIDFSYNRYNSDIRQIVNETFAGYDSILTECNNHFSIPKITVVNYVVDRKHLKKSISSISKQSFKDIEIICMSEDEKAVESLRDLATYDARIRVVDKIMPCIDLLNLISTDYIYLMRSRFLDRNLLSDLYARNSFGPGRLLDRNDLTENPKLYENFLHVSLNNMDSSNKSLLKENRKLKKELKGLKQSNDEILNSTSWKITKPFRFIVNLFRNKRYNIM